MSPGLLHSGIIFTKFELGQRIFSTYRYNVSTADTLRHAMTLTVDHLSMNVHSTSGVTWSNPRPNLSEREQATAELMMIK